MLHLSLSLPGSGEPSDLPDGKRVIAEMHRQNESIRDFSVTMNITFYGYFMSFPLKAQLYFKRPDKVKIVFSHVPDFLRGYEKQFKAVVPTETLKKKYQCRVMGKEIFEAVPYYVLKMSPVDEGNLRQAYMWVHSTNFTPARMHLTYRDGSTIEVENEFTSSGQVLVVKKQKINLRLTQLNAKSVIVYSKYHINEGLPDSFFEEKKPKGDENEHQ